MSPKFLALILFVTLLASCSKANKKTIYISDTKVDCTGVASQQCLQIKENESDSWSNFYGSIIGFDFEKGYQYKLKVEVSKIENPPADTTSETYTLLKVLEKTKAPLSISKGTWLVTKVNNNTEFSRNPVIGIDLSEGKIDGNTGCNRFFGAIAIEGNNIKISAVATTKMMCKDIEKETAFVEALSQTVTYKIKDETLLLFSKEGTTLLECSFLKN